MRRDPVDFLLIGAHKSATTTLYQQLRAHPEIYMPSVKEIGFFAVNELYERGMPFYCEQWFQDAGTRPCRGEASVGYMQAECAAARIARHLPQVKLVAVLRNPIERAYSHYRMDCRREGETRTFEQCVEAAVAGAKAGGKTSQRSIANLLRYGEYGRILAEFRRYFAVEQFHLIFLEKYERNPADTLLALQAWLGVQPTTDYLDLSRRFHQGGRARWPRLTSLAKRAKRLLFRPSPLGRVVSRIVPLRLQQAYRTFEFWLVTEALIQRESVPGPTPEIRLLLRDHFAPDVQRLAAEFGLEIPWDEFRVAQRASAVAA